MVKYELNIESHSKLNCVASKPSTKSRYGFICLDINFLWLIYNILLFCSFIKIANLQPPDCRLAEKLQIN